jgi:hypothetical protein
MITYLIPTSEMLADKPQIFKVAGKLTDMDQSIDDLKP